MHQAPNMQEALVDARRGKVLELDRTSIMMSNMRVGMWDYPGLIWHNSSQCMLLPLGRKYQMDIASRALTAEFMTSPDP